MAHQKSKVDVIIPVTKKGKTLLRVLDALAGQTVLPEKVILLNVETGERERSSEYLQNTIYHFFGKHKLFGNKMPLKIEIVSVEEKKFDKGATRNLGAEHSDSPFLLFMKETAVPADTKVIEELLWSMESGAGMAFARHVTPQTAGVLRTYTTLFDYPSKSYTRTEEDVEKYGIRAYHCSNACAMYRRDVFTQLGGFAKKIAASEDVLFAARMLKEGGKLTYCAEAKVYYMENENWMAQLRRKFDRGVVHAGHPRIFGNGGAERDGYQYSSQVISYLLNQKYYMELAEFIGENAFKAVGYFLGKHYRFLKKDWILHLTANKTYWSK